MVKCTNLKMEKIRMNEERKDILREAYQIGYSLEEQGDLHTLWIETLQKYAKTFGFSGKEEISFLVVKTCLSFEFFSGEINNIQLFSAVCSKMNDN